MKYKLLAVDLDGTLLRRDGSVHPDDRAAVARLLARGVPVTIVTGRLYSGSRATARTVELAGPIACADGSHIVELADDRDLFYRAIPAADAEVLRATLARHEAASFLFAPDGIVHDEVGAPFVAYVKTWSPNVNLVERVVEHASWGHARGLMAVVSVGTSAQIEAAAGELSAQLSAGTAVVTFPISSRHVGFHAMLVRAAGPTKGTAVEWLARHHGCSVAEVVAVGDWLNDLPMFKVAGRSFAMRGAPAAVRGAATDGLDAESGEGRGVAEVIAKAWGL